MAWCLGGRFGQFSPPAAAMVSALALAGCAGGGTFGGFGSSAPPEAAALPPPAPEIPPTIRVSEVIGRWGYAAYHKPEDRPRTEAAARAQCNHPYVIGQGPTGGVMMYLADQSELQAAPMEETISARRVRLAARRTARWCPSMAASCCCASQIPKSQVVTEPEFMCGVRRLPAELRSERNNWRLYDPASALHSRDGLHYIPRPKPIAREKCKDCRAYPICCVVS
jgi:hypothetical protein